MLPGGNAGIRIGVALLTASASLLVAAGSASAGSFSGVTSTPIVIPGPMHGSANPYPSQITASGVPGTVSDVNVGLRGFSEGNVPEVWVSLVSPSGRAMLLMAGVTTNTPASNVDLTIDDQAPGQFPDVPGTLSSGSYKPTNYQGSPAPSFISPGPSSFGNPGPQQGGTATLASIFNGDSPNGTWNLFVVSGFDGGTPGSFAGGWSLTLTTQEQAHHRKKCKKKHKHSAAAAKKKCKKKRR